MLRRHRLWNSLVEVERRYRLESAALLRDRWRSRIWRAARARLAELRQEIKSRRQAERKRTVEVSDLQVRNRPGETRADCRDRRRQRSAGARGLRSIRAVSSYWRRHGMKP